MVTDDPSATLRAVTRGCLVACLALCFLGCATRVVKPPLPLSDSDAAHQNRATITVLSVDQVSPMGHWDRWNLRMTIEISATKLPIVMALADSLWSSLYARPARYVWITRSNGRDLWLGGARALPDMIMVSYRYLREREVTQVAPDRFTATIQVTVPSYDLPSGELTIAFDGETMHKAIGDYGVLKSVPEGGIYCPAATVMAPTPTQTSSEPRAKPQSGAGIGTNP